jgi:peptide/nickel transport system substrate-binding protein
MTANLDSAEPALEFRVLGPLVVWRAGSPVRLGGIRQRAVLARLICGVGRVVTTDQLAAAVWGESVPTGYVSTLQTYIFHLRAALEPDRLAGAPPMLLRTEASGYRLDLDPDWATLDANQFEASAAAGRASIAAGDARAAVTDLRAALALWHGDVLADFRDFEFVGPYADRLNGLFVDAEESRLDAELALGNNTAVADAAASLIQSHGLRERFHAQRMLALYRCGRQSEALSVYTQLRQLLVDELGIEPNHQLQELQRKILDQDPELDGHPTGQSPTIEAPGAAATGPRSRSYRLRDRTVLLAGAAAVIIAIGTIGGVAWHNDGSSRTPAAGPNSAVEIGTSGRVKASVALGQPPGGIVATPTSVWITNPANSSVTRIDPKTHRRLASIPVGHDPVALAIHQGQVWVADNTDGKIQQISPQTNTVVRTITVGHNPSAIADGLGFLWIANQGDGTATRIDPSGRIAARTIPVGGEPDGIAVGNDAVWVANQFDNTVSRIDPSSLSTSTIAVGVGPAGMAVTRTAVWVADSLDLTVARIDLTHNDSVTKVETGDSPTAVAEFHGAIWVSNAGDATISRLDEATGRVTKTYAFGSSPNGLAVSGSALWVSSKAFASAAHRGGTLTVAAVSPDDGLSSIDPALAYDGDVYDGMSEVYDTLVTLRKSTGLTGLDLVPDLAVQLPTPTDGGRTYVFQLRPNIKYSIGQPLRASDFRRGLERTLLVEQEAASYFSDIVGAAACTQKPAHCDLAAGVVTDDAANTVTIHLVKPDPDLLGALSITGFSTPVPPSTPMTHDVGTTPVPGTGPYMISQFTPTQSLTLSRNPHFVRWSSAAQPDGYPDRIVWKGYPNPLAAIEAVGAGSGADVFYVNRTIDRNASVAQLLQDYPRQVVSTQSFASHFLVLNSATPPFDNPLARKAVAQALTADPTLAAIDNGTPSCTIVPPGFPGEPPACTYTENRTAAAATVRASGTEGDTVHVYFRNFAPFAQLGTYVTEVLNQIGYHAELTLEDDYRADVYNPKTRPVNIEGETWFPDFPADSQFWINETCDPAAFLHQLDTCNPAVDADANTALAAQQTDPSTAQLDWQRAYALMDADARLVPMDVPPSVDLLVSPRVGNAQLTPSSALEALLDQFWVH